MDWLAVGNAIVNAGGWTAFLGLVALIGVTGARRVWVWGWIYDKSESRAATSDTQAERNAESLESLSRAYEVMGRSYDRLERDFDTLSSRRVNRD